MHRRQLLKTVLAGSLGAVVAQADREAAVAGYEVTRSRCVRVETGPVSLRAEPSLRGRVVGVAPAGACGTVPDQTFVAADGYSWARVTLDASEPDGWVPTWYLTALSP
jgi:hypothetical protein